MTSKNILNWSFICLLLYLCVLFTSCGSSEKQIIQQPVLTDTPIEDLDNTLFFVGEQNFAPISFEKEGAVMGISPDIIREVFHRMGYNVKIKLVPWKRALEMAKDNEVDGFFSAYKSAEREDIYIYPNESLLVEKNVFVVRKDSTITYDGDISKLDKHGIGTLIGYITLDKYIEKKIITNVDRSPNTEASLNKLMNGDRNVDLVVNTNYIIWYTAEKMGIADSLKELSIPLTETPSYLVFSKKKDRSEMVAKFEAELQRMKTDGSYDRIIQKYVTIQN